MYEIIIPVATVSEANRHEPRRVAWRRHKAQRDFTRVYVGSLRTPDLRTGTWHITMTRLKPGQRCDQGNLAMSMKWVQDGMCQALGVDDGDPRIHWEYRQEPAQQNEVRVRIEEVNHE